MKFFERYIHNTKIKMAIFVTIFIGWLIPYLMPNNYAVSEVLGQLIVAIMACASLILFKDTEYLLEILLLFPFIFSRSFTVERFPVHLAVIVAMVMISVVIHCIIYKPKLKRPKFFIGLAAIAISLVTGGLLMEYNDKFFKMFMLFWMAFGLLIVFVFLSSTTNPTFKELAIHITLLALFIILQVIVYSLGHLDTLLLQKRIDVGWGSTNNVAMIMLFTVPFTFYLGFKEKKLINKIACYAGVCLELLVIILTFSRGGLLAAVISYGVLAIILVIRKETRKELLTVFGAFFGIIICAVLVLAIVRFDLLKSAFGLLTKINLDSLNGRMPIYQQMLTEVKEQPIFGFGVYHSFVDEEYEYLWGHNTFIQTVYTLGIVGLIAMIYHHVEKYAFCLRKINLEKLIILFSFVATDLYGFIDVSYFFINFMVVLLVILIMLNKSLDGIEGLENEIVIA